VQYSKSYGTTAARLGQGSQLTFGDCALSLHPAKEQPVATPSGFVYERASILEYLLTKTQELKQQQQEYEQWLAQQENEKTQEDQKKRKAQVEQFEDSQKVVTIKKQKVDEANPLKRTSYWLAEFQPESDEKAAVPPPPKRPPSPMSKQPLRRKDLIELDLKRNSQDQVLCAVSEKSIVSQQALALITKSGTPAQVVLEQVYNDLGKERTCPVTGKKITKILKLQTGGSSFAAGGGVVEARTYRPTMT
jgi:ATPase subunit of ABC transporter with duplicated ATPase domains